MKKLIILSMVCVFSSILYAQETSYPSTSNPDPIAEKISGPPDTQSASLGLQNFQTENEFNVWLNPAQLTVWQTAYGEVWNANPWGGVTTNSPYGYFGVYVGRPYGGSSGGFAVNSTGMGITGLTTPPAALAITGNIVADNMAPLAITNNNIDLMYGRVFDDSMSLGARLSMANNINETNYSYSNPDNTNGNPVVSDGSAKLKQETTDMEISVGLLMKELLIFQKADIAATVTMPSVNNVFTESRISVAGPATAANTQTLTDKLSAKNSSNMSVLFRGIKDVEDNPLILTVGYGAVDVSAERDSIADTAPTVNGDTAHRLVTYGDKTTNIMLDASYQTKPAPHLKVIYTAGYRSSSRTNEVKMTDLNLTPSVVTATLIGDISWAQAKTDTMSIPVSVAVEHQTWSKVCTRLGINKNIINTTKTSGQIKNNYDSNADNVYDTSTDLLTGDLTTNPVVQAPIVTLGMGIMPMKDFSIDIAIVTNAYNFTTLISRGSIRYHF